VQENKNIAEALSGKKLQIVTASYELFHERGYTATSMRDISEAVGLTKASLYHHYASKEELMEGVLYYIQRFLRLEIFCIAYQEQMTPKQRLTEYISKQKDVFLMNKKSCFIGNMTLEIAPLSPKFATLLKEIFDEWVESLGDIYAHRHSKKKSKELAMQAVAEFEGAVMIGQLTPGNNSVLDKAIKRAIKRFNKKQIPNETNTKMGRTTRS
jgi:AcrR family transcriptional regulator